MEALLKQLQTLGAEADEASREALLSGLTDLQMSLEAPYTTLLRFSSYNTVFMALRIAVDMGVLRALADSKEGHTIDELGEACKVPTDWLRPLLALLASNKLVKEVGKDKFAGNEKSDFIASNVGEAGVRFFFDLMGALIRALPASLAENGYRMYSSPAHTAVHKAFNTDLPVFDWLNTQPHLLKDFHIAMSIQRTELTWLSKFDFPKELGNWPADGSKPVFVDIGGGFGQQCANLVAQYPQPEGSVILQDQPQVLDKAEEIKGVKMMPHDFFQPQPVKGAKFYYMRTVLHDHPDNKCHEILKHLRDATVPESRVLIDDVVLPETGVHWEAAQMDLVMAASHAAKERRADEWGSLLANAGFKIEKIATYSQSTQVAVIVAAPI